MEDKNSTQRNENDQFITKLKEEHQNEIQKLTYESKIKLLETENETRMKIVSLEKDNQTLRHQLDIVQLKNSQELDSKDNELKMKMVEKDQEMLAKENGYLTKINDLENINKLKLLELTKEKDATIQLLRSEIEMLKSKILPQENVKTKPTIV